MSKLPHIRLSRRERQIMDILYKRGESSVADVLEAIPDPPTYSTVRAILRILEEKGQATHKDDGVRYVYRPAESWGSVAKSSIEQIVDTFFEGSVEKAVAALLSSKNRPSEEELTRLELLIAGAKEREGEAQ